jgi:hypothetical protein
MKHRDLTAEPGSFKDGEVVAGPFMSDNSLGIGIVRDSWGPRLVHRISGGYAPEDLVRLPELKPANAR